MAVQSENYGWWIYFQFDLGDDCLCMHAQWGKTATKCQRGQNIFCSSVSQVLWFLFEAGQWWAWWQRKWPGVSGTTGVVGWFGFVRRGWNCFGKTWSKIQSLSRPKSCSFAPCSCSANFTHKTFSNETALLLQHNTKTFPEAMLAQPAREAFIHTGHCQIKPDGAKSGCLIACWITIPIEWRSHRVDTVDHTPAHKWAMTCTVDHKQNRESLVVWAKGCPHAQASSGHVALLKVNNVVGILNFGLSQMPYLSFHRKS